LYDADISLALNGSASNQLVDMVNWWLRETGKAGESVKQIGVSPDPVTGYWTFNAAADTVGTGHITAADLANGIEVDGHSLGGYLASAFTRLFGVQAHVTGTSTFNSAGFAPGSDLIFQRLDELVGTSYGLGRFPNASEQSNYFAVHGLNVTTNSFWFSQQGTRVELFNEQSTFLGTDIPNHYMYKLTDSLALTAAMAQLDATLTTQRATAIFESGSNVISASLEGVLDALRRMLGGSSVQTTPADDASDSEPSRVAYHANLKALTDSAMFQSLAGNVTLEASGNLIAQAQARNSFADIVALETLAPFVIRAAGTGGESALDGLWQSGAWGDSYNAWLQDKSLELLGKPAQTYTDQWLTDRALLLDAIVMRNSKDGTDIAYGSAFPVARAYELRWVDAQGVDQVLLAENTSRQGGVLQPVPMQLIAFGSDADDTLKGSDSLKLGDHLYGGGGADALNGRAGDDYLQGDGGDDVLDGGDGGDTLFGGSGNDRLEGGVGNDQLHGGTGADTYRFSAGWGNDTIVDSDGIGVIKIDDVTILAGQKVAEGVWRNEDQGILYKLSGSGVDRSLFIQKDGNPNDSIRIQGWKDGDLGLTMEGAAAPTDASHNFIGDQSAPLNSNGSYGWSATSWAADGTLIGGVADKDFNDVIYASAEADSISGLGGNDALGGGAGDDQIDGGEGDDLIAGGAGSDTLHGGAGNDFIFTANDLSGGLQRSTPTDQWSGQGGRTVWTRGSTWGTYRDNMGINPADASIVVGAYTEDDVAYGEAGDDAIMGGLGADYLDGGDGNDVIWGHGGGDILVGGAGDDQLSGDGTHQPGLYNTVADNQNGNDFLDGGSGNDTLWGGGANDVLYGGTGNDLLIGDDGQSEDLAFEAHGNDWLAGEEGDDSLFGGGKDDTLYGGAGNDVLFGDDNATVLPTQHHGRDYLDGGDGNDYLEGGANADTLLGGDGDDELWGDTSQTAQNSAEDGADDLAGGAGNDTLGVAARMTRCTAASAMTTSQVMRLPPDWLAPTKETIGSKAKTVTTHWWAAVPATPCTAVPTTTCW
jgi:Ca2+-binding RTX toxin-like protein